MAKNSCILEKIQIMNYRKFLWLLVATLPLFLSSCESKEVEAHEHEHEHAINVDSLKALVQSLNTDYAKNENEGNVDAIAGYYANDAESLADGEPTRVGIEAIKAGLRKDIESDTSDYTLTFTTDDVWAAGKYITETGTVTNKDKDGKVVHTGKYMTLYELRDGKYLAIRDIWNSDTPPSPTK